MLDLRVPVGIFFLLTGLILVLDGLIHPIRTAGVDLVLNRDWGAVLFAFGILMAIPGIRAQRLAARDRHGPPGDDAAPRDL